MLSQDFFSIEGDFFIKEKVISKEQIKSEIDEASSFFLKMTSNSPFVYLYTSNHIKTHIYYFAILKAKKIAVILDPDTTEFELNERKEIVYPACIIKPNLENDNYSINELEFLPHSTTFSVNSDISDIVSIFFSNAEDGYIKAVMLTMNNLLASAKVIVEADEFPEEAKTTCTLAPFYHIWGFVTGVIIPAYYNWSVQIEDIRNLVQITSFAERIYNNKVSNIYSVPLVFYLLTKVKDISRLLSYLKRPCCGGHKLSENIQDAFYSKVGMKIHEGYGLTEAAGICSGSKFNNIVNIKSVGRPMSCCKIGVVKNESTSDDKIGEITIQGENVMKGYFNNKKATDKYLKNGILYTGDKGYIDNEGYLIFTGVSKNMLNVGGHNVYPKEVERQILKSNLVEEIIVYGEKNILNSDTVFANIKLISSSEEAKIQFENWCKYNLASIKIPKRINYL